MPHSEVTEVIISQGFRGGTLSYRKGDHEVPFDWECCGRAAVMIWGTQEALLGCQSSLGSGSSI